MHPDLPPDRAPLDVDRVEWVPASPEAVHVLVFGRWRDRPVGDALLLLVGAGHRRHAFEALAPPPPGALAGFAVPNELRPRLGEDIALQVGSHELALPAAVPGALGEEGAGPGDEAEVIDHAVLAERRARRAELAEEALTRRATAAEQTAATLEAQLRNLEERLAQARDERDELESRLADAERRLRSAEQREYAEQRSRIEAQDELEELRRRHGAETEDLRRRLDTANRRAEELAREVDLARRTVQRPAQEAASLQELAERLEEHIRALEAARAAGTALQLTLDSERRERAHAEAALHEQLVQARAEGQRALLEAEVELRVALDAERAARRATEARLAEARGDLDRLRAGDEARAARDAEVQRLAVAVVATAAALREAFERESRKLEGELTERVVAERRRMAEEMRAMQQRLAEEQAARTGRNEGVIADLAAAAERLREQVPPEDAAEADPSDGVLLPRRAAAAGRPPSPWLCEAISRLAARDEQAAGRLVAALLPVQRLLLDGDLAYDLTVTGLGTFRVALRGEAATVHPIGGPGGRREADFRLEGRPAALAPLVGGGARRRLDGVRLQGSRRRLRRLLKALREPVGLAEVARSGAAVEPGLVLAALSAAVDPGWAAGHAFTIAFVVEGDRGGEWTVHVGRGAPRVEPGLASPGATATVQVPDVAFLPLLAGVAPPPGRQARASGDVHAVELLRRWFAQAQGLG